MLAVITLGLISVAWTAYEFGRNVAPSIPRAQAWDQDGRPVVVVEVLEKEGVRRG